MTISPKARLLTMFILKLLLDLKPSYANRDDSTQSCLTFTSRLFEALAAYGRASGLYDVAIRVSGFSRIGGGEFIRVLPKLNGSPDRNRPGISPVRVEPEKHYGVSEAPPTSVLPYSVAGAE